MCNKVYFQNMFLKLTEPLKSHYSEGGACLNLGAFAAGYGNRIAGMEGFSRVLWGLVSYWAGGGTDESLLPVCQKGLRNGTDPSSEEYWGDLPGKDQRMVEMAAIAYGIMMIPEKLWEPLGTETQNHLAAWLGQINLYPQGDNNWQYFNVIVNLALKSVGKPWSRERMEYAMGRYEAFYLGNGWYSDGEGGPRDYYVSFGIHFYCLLYARFMREENPEQAEIFSMRARTFARSFLYWFDEEGKALPFGRSLTYRFAQTAFWSVCALNDVLPCGMLKGIIRRNLDYWLRQPILDNGGILTVGYTYPNLLMSESYNAPGSPYWSFKAFVFLSLPDDHEFWKAEELPLPRLEPVKLIPECRMLLCHRPYEVTALTAGQYPRMEHPNTAEKYCKFAYSSRLGFCVSRSYQCLEHAGTDSMLVFHVHDMYYVRRRCLETSFTEAGIYSRWSPAEGITVETWLIPTEKGHRRRHRVSSSLECQAYDCGFSYPNCMEETEKTAKEGYAVVSDRNGMSSVQSPAGKGFVITCLPNLNLVFPNVCIPSVILDIPRGITEWETIIETELKPGKTRIGGNCYEMLCG